MQHKENLEWDGEGILYGEKVVAVGETAKALRLGSWGMVDRLYFEKGGSARVVLHLSDLKRLLEGIHHLEMGRRDPDEELIAAAHLIAKKLGQVDRPGWCVQGHPVIAHHAVDLERVDLGIDPESGDLVESDELSSDDT